MKENIEVALREEMTALREKEKKVNAYPLSVELLTASEKLNAEGVRIYLPPQR